MIRTVIFDIGYVLTRLEWPVFIRKFGFPEETIARLEKATVDSAAWNEFDRGLLSEQEQLEAFIANDPPMEEQIRQVYANLHGIVAKADYAIPWILELKKKGFQVLVLSNFSEKAKRENADAMDFLDYVDGGILSCEVGLIKPDPAIYRLLLARYSLKPEECVFLDDRPENVEAAEQQGIRGIVFRDFDQARRELEVLCGE